MQATVILSGVDMEAEGLQERLGKTGAGRMQSRLVSGEGNGHGREKWQETSFPGAANRTP